MTVTLDAQTIASAAGRSAGALTRRDVARALLATPSADALAVLPDLRRQLVAAGNPLSQPFWDGAAATLRKIADKQAAIGDVRSWIEATGTEPSQIIGLHVWDDESERSPLQREMYDLLVAHLEERVAGGAIDPDRLAAGDAAAVGRYRKLQEEWMMAPLPDGRVPMWIVTDEADEEFLAEWDAAEADALSELQDVLADLPDRPLPEADLRTAVAHVRGYLQQPGWLSELLAACGGVNPQQLPGDDAELWLTLAAGIVSPKDGFFDELDSDEALSEGALPNGELPGDELPSGEPTDDELFDDELLDDEGDELSERDRALAALCSIDHYDWLAVVAALARGGPGTSASADDLGRYVVASDDDGDDLDVDNLGVLDGGELDELDAVDLDDVEIDDEADAVAETFMYAVRLWQVLGAVDEDEQLTELGWWGIPEGVRRAWQPQK